MVSKSSLQIVFVLGVRDGGDLALAAGNCHEIVDVRFCVVGSGERPRGA